MKKQFIIIVVLCFFNSISFTTDKNFTYKDIINNAITLIQEKNISEIINKGTIITSGLGAGFQTYGYLATYAKFQNPYINGAIHYASWQAAYAAYLATITSMTLVEKFIANNEKNTKEDNKEHSE